MEWPSGDSEKLEYGYLASFYSLLLTSRQRSVVELYCNEDLSIGEIGAQLGVTRQSVHDTLQRAFGKLADAETKLSLGVRFRETSATLRYVMTLLQRARARGAEAPELAEAVEILGRHLSKEDQ